MSHLTGEKSSIDHKSSTTSSLKDDIAITKDPEAAIAAAAGNAPAPNQNQTAQEPDLEKAEQKKPPGGIDPASFPDGGLEAWLVVSGGFACLFSSFGWINAIGVFQTEWEKNQLRSYSPSDISWIPSLEGRSAMETPLFLLQELTDTCPSHQSS